MESTALQHAARLGRARFPRGFPALLATYTFNEIAEQFGIVALAVLVYDRTSSPIAVAAVFLVGKFFPALCAPTVTARFAHYRGRTSLAGLYVTETVLYVVLAFLAWRAPELQWLLPAVFLQGVVALTARGLSRGTVATLLSGEELLRRGNAWINVVSSVGSVAGPLAAVAVLALTSTAWVLVVGGLAFLLSAVIVAIGGAALPTAEHREEDGEQRRSAREGLRYLWDSGPTRRILAGQAIAWTFATIIIPIEVVYAKEALGTDSTGYGWLLAAWGAGMVIGIRAAAQPALARGPKRD